jgi:hypothetical protein
MITSRGNESGLRCGAVQFSALYWYLTIIVHHCCLITKKPRASSKCHCTCLVSSQQWKLKTMLAADKVYLAAALRCRYNGVRTCGSLMKCSLLFSAVKQNAICPSRSSSNGHETQILLAPHLCMPLLPLSCW